jgi:Lrp/AsnC family leucine-responsive transcriptional regulator
MLKDNLDATDWNILAILQQSARISNVELADRVHLTPSPCLARVKALEESEIIRRYVALLDPSAVGLGVSVLVQVTLDRQVESALAIFEQAVAKRPEVMECYLMTGVSDYLLRVAVADLDEFQRFVVGFLSRIPGMGSIRSSVALKRVKYKTELPLPVENKKAKHRSRR